MATYRERLVARMDAIAAELAAMTPEQAGGKPNVKTADGGTTIDHVGYRKSLLEELEMLEKRLENAPAVEAGGDTGPFEIVTHFLP